MSTIFAPITSLSNSGVTLIRISGPQTIACLQALGLKSEPKHQKVTFHKIFDGPKLLDEVLISFFKNPQSFTGEDLAEISIHASPFILQQVCKILSSQKEVRFAQAGEFSKRAFLNNKIDLVQAEAIPDLISAETASQHQQALKQLNGKLGQIYEDWRFRLVEISAMIEAAIDFPDEDLPQNIIDNVEEQVQKLLAEIKSHINDQNIGQKIKQGLNLAIIGAPNVGKSSLINFLAQSEVAIVSEIAGTTRDIVETHLSIAGVAVKISDTAGIRQSNDLVEAEGIRRALKKAGEADIKIFLIDSTNPVINHDLIDDNTIVIVNKSDLKKSNLDQKFLEISIKEQINTAELIHKLEKKITKIIPNQTSPLITQERYRSILQDAAHNLENFSMNKNIELAAEDLRMTAREIGKITGKVDIENILDVIFSRFCIGK